MRQAPLRIKHHLSYNQITAQYKSCAKIREKTYWHLVWLMANPQNPMMIKQAAKIVGYCERRARILVNRCNNKGFKSLIDNRCNNEGQEAMLTDKQKKKLKNAILKEKPSDGGLWTSVKVSEWIGKTAKINPPSAVTGWKYLKELGFTIQQPRTKHIHSASEKEIKIFKKNFL